MKSSSKTWACHPASLHLSKKAFDVEVWNSAQVKTVFYFALCSRTLRCIIATGYQFIIGRLSGNNSAWTVNLQQVSEEPPRDERLKQVQNFSLCERNEVKTIHFKNIFFLGARRQKIESNLSPAEWFPFCASPGLIWLFGDPLLNVYPRKRAKTERDWNESSFSCLGRIKKKVLVQKETLPPLRRLRLTL